MKSVPRSLPIPLLCALLSGCGGPTLFGSITLDKTDIGSGTRVPGDCASGLFRGADFTADGVSVRVLRTELKQPAIVVTHETTKKTITLSRASCSRLDIDVFRNVVPFDEHPEYFQVGPRGELSHEDLLKEAFRHREDGDTLTISGSAVFDCTLPAGGRAWGTLYFSCPYRGASPVPADDAPADTGG